MRLFINQRSGFKVIWVAALLGSLVLTVGADDPVQAEEVVKIQAFLSQNGVHAGKTIQLAIKAEIAPTWHIHAHVLSDEFLIPTNLVMEETEGFTLGEVFYPEPALEKYEYSDVKLEVYEGEAVFGACFQTKTEVSPGSYILKGKFKFQACDHSSCLPPKGLDFEVIVNVVASEQEVEAINQEVFALLKFGKDQKK